MTTRREFLRLITTGAATLPFWMTACQQKPTAPRPNVVLIMTDDQGYGDFGVMGNPIIETPNIDAMAQQSASMTTFYVSPVCAPTRACLMTGRYNYRTRAIDTYIGRAMMEPEEVTVAEVLQDAGYTTGIFGKWHLGDNYPMRAMDQGFEESLVHRGGGIGQPSDPPEGEGQYTNPVLFHNGEKVQKQGYCTDIYFDHAINWMDKVNADGKPFFSYIATNAPHGPFHDVPEELYQKYKAMDLGNDEFPQEKGHPLEAGADQDVRARIFAMITNIDQNVGKLLDHLKETGLLENTIVIYLNDNGPNRRRYVAGMRGNKSSVYEGGIRSPLWVYWPDKLEAGHSSDRISAHIDVMPTILEACGVDKPSGVELDGRSLWPLLTAQDVEWPDRTIVIQAHRGDKPVRYHHFMIRNQRWKLLHHSGFGSEDFAGEPDFELYDMKNDPLEMNNVADEHPDIVKKLKTAYDEWFEDVSSTRPDNYAPPRIFIGTLHENPVVLTRQDWRHVKGRPWGADSNGFWMLNVASAGTYEVILRNKDVESAGQAELEIGEKIWQQNFEQGQTEIVFESLTLSQCPANLKATLNMSDKTKGPWQVVVRKTD